MKSITLYTFKDSDGLESNYSTFNPSQAEEYARRWKLVCIANEFTFAGSKVVAWDYTEKGAK